MRLLVRDVDWCCTFDDDDTELAHADVLVDEGVVVAVGEGLAVDEPVDRVVDGRGLVLPPISSARRSARGSPAWARW